MAGKDWIAALAEPALSAAEGLARNDKKEEFHGNDSGGVRTVELARLYTLR
ncbi:MAG: hypothetical protein LBJ48_06980 [Coriobacteriales bacterium]|nr:hypothetical protein [Coriobacteriales bacterium]